jgi:hypothetical protein
VRTCFFFCESARKLSSLHLPCRRTGGVVWSGGCLLACSSGHCHCAASGSDRQSCLLTSARPLPLKYTSSKVAMAANVHVRSAESPTSKLLIAWTTFSTISKMTGYSSRKELNTLGSASKPGFRVHPDSRGVRVGCDRLLRRCAARLSVLSIVQHSIRIASSRGLFPVNHKVFAWTASNLDFSALLQKVVVEWTGVFGVSRNSTYATHSRCICTYYAAAVSQGVWDPPWAVNG